MMIKAAGYVVDLEAETLEERRKTPRRRLSDLERTVTENVARCRLEDTASTTGNSDTPSNDGVSSDDVKQQYEAFLTDPRRI